MNAQSKKVGFLLEKIEDTLTNNLPSSMDYALTILRAKTILLNWKNSKFEDEFDSGEELDRIFAYYNNACLDEEHYNVEIRNACKFIVEYLR